jgi:hypothetical protein
MPAGRPTDYRPEFAIEAEKLCRLGATDPELADFFDVSITTIWNWSRRYEEFLNAIKVGKDAADDRVEKSLYHRALGYSFDSVKIFNAGGEALEVPYREHVPPDPTAMIFWLKNRRSGAWRDRREVTGEDGGPLAIAIVRYSDVAADALGSRPEPGTEPVPHVKGGD